MSARAAAFSTTFSTWFCFRITRPSQCSTSRTTRVERQRRRAGDLDVFASVRGRPVPVRLILEMRGSCARWPARGSRAPRASRSCPSRRRSRRPLGRPPCTRSPRPRCRCNSRPRRSRRPRATARPRPGQAQVSPAPAIGTAAARSPETPLEAIGRARLEDSLTRIAREALSRTRTTKGTQCVLYAEVRVREFTCRLGCSIAVQSGTAS